jgi:hypothetical protein
VLKIKNKPGYKVELQNSAGDIIYVEECVHCGSFQFTSLVHPIEVKTSKTPFNSVHIRFIKNHDHQ